MVTPMGWVYVDKIVKAVLLYVLWIAFSTSPFSKNRPLTNSSVSCDVIVCIYMGVTSQDVNRLKKIPHTGDKASLDRCG